MNTINERIKLVRKGKNLTQKQFADRILVTQFYLSRLEIGIILEMKSFLKSISNESQGLQSITFEKISGAIMELFIQLQTFSTDIKFESFNSMAWMSTLTLTKSLAELKEVYFNSEIYRL